MVPNTRCLSGLPFVLLGILRYDQCCCCCCRRSSGHLSEARKSGIELHIDKFDDLSRHSVHLLFVSTIHQKATAQAVWETATTLSQSKLSYFWCRYKNEQNLKANCNFQFADNDVDDDEIDAFLRRWSEIRKGQRPCLFKEGHVKREREREKVMEKWWWLEKDNSPTFTTKFAWKSALRGYVRHHHQQKQGRMNEAASRQDASNRGFFYISLRLAAVDWFLR